MTKRNWRKTLLSKNTPWLKENTGSISSDLTVEKNGLARAPAFHHCTVCLNVQPQADTSRSDKVTESKRGHLGKDRLRVNWDYDFTWETAIPDSLSFIFLLRGFFLRQLASLNFGKSNLKVKKILLNAQIQYTLFLCCNHTHRGDCTMWKRQASAAHCPRRDSETGNSQGDQEGSFPTTFLLIKHPSWWGPPHTAAMGTSAGPHNPMQVTDQPCSILKQSRAPAPSAHIPALRIGRTRSLATQGWIWTGITWGTLNIIKVGPHTDNMTKNLWSGGKNVSTKGFINLMSRMC